MPDAAVLGSFWAVPEEGRLISMLAGWKATKDSDDKQLPCTQLVEILLANKGTRAKVELQDKSLYSGVIQDVLVDKTEAPVAPAQLELLDLSPLSSAAKPKSAAALHVEPCESIACRGSRKRSIRSRRSAARISSCGLTRETSCSPSPKCGRSWSRT